jgi:hypothetical protein
MASYEYAMVKNFPTKERDLLIEEEVIYLNENDVIDLRERDELFAGAIFSPKGKGKTFTALRMLSQLKNVWYFDPQTGSVSNLDKLKVRKLWKVHELNTVNGVKLNVCDLPEQVANVFIRGRGFVLDKKRKALKDFFRRNKTQKSWKEFVLFLEEKRLAGMLDSMDLENIISFTDDGVDLRDLSVGRHLFLCKNIDSQSVELSLLLYALFFVKLQEYSDFKERFGSELVFERHVIALDEANSLCGVGTNVGDALLHVAKKGRLLSIDYMLIGTDHSGIVPSLVKELRNLFFFDYPVESIEQLRLKKGIDLRNFSGLGSVFQFFLPKRADNSIRFGWCFWFNVDRGLVRADGSTVCEVSDFWFRLKVLEQRQSVIDSIRVVGEVLWGLLGKGLRY